MTSEISSAPELIYYCEFDPENWDDRLEITFSNEYKIYIELRCLDKLVINIIKEKDIRGKLDNLSVHKSLFGKNFLNVTAIAGINGAGKTTLLKNIFFNELIDSFFLVLYKVNESEFEVEGQFGKFTLRKLNGRKYSYFVKQQNKNKKFLAYNLPLSIQLSDDLIDSHYPVIQKGYSDIYKLLFGKKTISKNFKDKFKLPKRIKFSLSFFKNNYISLRKLCEGLDRDYNIEHGNIGLIDQNYLEEEFNNKIRILREENYNKGNSLIFELLLALLDMFTKLTTFDVNSSGRLIYNYLYHREDDQSSLKDFVLNEDLVSRVFPGPGLKKRRDSIVDLINSLPLEKDLVYEEYDESIDKFLKAYDRLSKVWVNDALVSYLEINIEGFSSGEEAILFQISALASKLSENISTDEGKLRSIIIIIDEYENHLHPEWARRYLNYLLAFLNDYVSRDKNLFFQIILTTHSPYLISDLPKESIRLIGRNKKTGKREVSIPKHGFASNYYDILSDSFFLEDTIGEFAKQKINSWIKELDELGKKNISAFSNNDLAITWEIDKRVMNISIDLLTVTDRGKLSRIDELKELINIVDDQFIRNKLLELAEDVRTHILEKPENSKNSRIKLIDQEIAKLEAMKKKLSEEPEK